MKSQELHELENEYSMVKNQNKNFERDNEQHLKAIEEIKKKIEQQEEIKKVYSEKVIEKREKYQLYMEHLKITKSSQVKKYEALQMNLDKIFYMQRELSIFLKMTNKNYTNGLQFLDLLKEIDGNAGIEQIQKDLRYDEDEDAMDDVYEEKNKHLKDEKVDLTLKDIRDILLNVNTRILNKNMNK